MRGWIHLVNIFCKGNRRPCWPPVGEGGTATAFRRTHKLTYQMTNFAWCVAWIAHKKYTNKNTSVMNGANDVCVWPLQPSGAHRTSGSRQIEWRGRGGQRGRPSVAEAERRWQHAGEEHTLAHNIHTQAFLFCLQPKPLQQFFGLPRLFISSRRLPMYFSPHIKVHKVIFYKFPLNLFYK